MQKTTMKILIFNWRDISSPFAGGAEVYLHQIARRLADNHEIVIYCGRYAGCLKDEHIEGIRVIRQGNRFSLYIWAFFDYLFKLRKERFDVIIDSINGFPFFTPLFIRRPKVTIIHHLVKRGIFFRELSLPLATIAWGAERMIPFVYHKTPVVTVSQSSMAELIDFGIPEHRIRAIPNAVDDTIKGAGPKTAIEKSENPSIIYLGRIKGYKQLDHLLRAFALVADRLPQAELTIAGRGDYSQLEKLVAELGLGPSVRLIGEVSEEEKIGLLKRAWLFATTSLKEGWGVSVLEANACYTPAIAYNVPGLRDAIKDTETGLLIPAGDIEKLGQAIISVLSNAEWIERLGLNAQHWASTFDWARSAENFLQVLKEVNSKKNSGEDL